MQIYELGYGNKVFVGKNVRFETKNVLFKPPPGLPCQNNILFFGDDLNLGDGLIKFCGSDSIAFFGWTAGILHADIALHNKSAVFIGVNNYFNPHGEKMHIIVSERKHFVMGNACNMSSGIWVRNADPHLIYSTETKKRLNPTRSIFIGDHVWIGQSTMLLKRTQIGSGAVIGGGAIVSGKKIPSNTIWAGNPARQVKDKIFWFGESVHSFTEEQTAQYSTMDTDRFTYERNAESLSFDEIDRALSESPSSDDKMKVLLELSNNTAKNRFAV